MDEVQARRNALLESWTAAHCEHYDIAPEDLDRMLARQNHRLGISAAQSANQFSTRDMERGNVKQNRHGGGCPTQTDKVMKRLRAKLVSRQAE